MARRPLELRCASPAITLVVCSLGLASPVRAEPASRNAQSGALHLSSSVRRVDAPTAKTEKQGEPAAHVGSREEGSSPARPLHQKGRPPRQPAARLPEGETPPQPDLRARHRVAQGLTDEERKLPSRDPELRALAEAEKTMFASQLRGVRPGWSWVDAASSAGSTEVAATGLPPLGPAPSADSDDRELAVDDEWLRSLAMPDLPVRMESRVVKYLKFYRDSDKGQAIAHVWAKKAGRFAPALRAEFSKAGLPRDLIWLSLIESGHNPTIKSPAGAAGLWQFIPSSARMYGLTVDRWVDERLDPARSTQAAIRFLSDLYQRFGSWELAMAAYNMGYAGMSRAIQKFNTNDFWQLSRYEAGLPWETTLYVPKIFAIAIVMNNKRAFGIDDVEPDPPESFDTVLVQPGQPLSDVARAAEVSEAELTRLNPQYLAARVPPPSDGTDRWTVRVPDKTGTLAASRLSADSGERYDAYRVRFGDTLEAIAAEYDVTEESLAQINGIRRGERLISGTALLLPKGAKRTPLTGRRVVALPASRFAYPTRRRVFYEVRAGDGLPAVASAFGVTQAELVAWNALDAAARLQDGMVLQVFIPKGRNLQSVRHLSEAEATLMVAGTSEFYDHHEALNGKTRLIVTCKQGDSLASLGRRYGMSVGSMERVNRRSRRDPLVVGEKIVVYADSGARGQMVSEGTPVALGSIEAPHPELLPPPERAAPGGSGETSVKAGRKTLD